MSEDDEDMNGENQDRTPEERLRQMDFILNQQEQFAANQQKSDERIGRLERVMKLVLHVGLRERKETREKINALLASRMHITETQARMDEALTRVADAQANLANAQAHSDARLDALIDIVRNERNGKS